MKGLVELNAWAQMEKNPVGKKSVIKRDKRPVFEGKNMGKIPFQGPIGQALDQASNLGSSRKFPD
jgi:hypothetical protein